MTMTRRDEFHMSIDKYIEAERAEGFQNGLKLSNDNNAHGREKLVIERDTAEALLAEARKKIEALKDSNNVRYSQGHVDGYKAGRKDGIAAAQAKLKEVA